LEDWRNRIAVIKNITFPGLAPIPSINPQKSIAGIVNPRLNAPKHPLFALGKRIAFV